MSCLPDCLEVLEVASSAAADALAEDLVAIDVTENLPFTDVFLVATADNPRHQRAVQSAVIDALRGQLGIHPRAEGGEDSDWALIDAGPVTLHVMLREARDFYALEKLWGASPRVALPRGPDPVPPRPAPVGGAVPN